MFLGKYSLYLKNPLRLPGGQWLRVCAPSAGGSGSMPGQGARSKFHLTKDPAYSN